MVWGLDGRKMYELCTDIYYMMLFLVSEFMRCGRPTMLNCTVAEEVIFKVVTFNSSNRIILNIFCENN